jgi:hypothetical protein
METHDPATYSTEALSVYESVASLWHPASSQIDVFRGLVHTASEVGEEALCIATIAGLQGSGGNGSSSFNGSAQSAALSATPLLLSGLLDAIAEASDVTGNSTLARALRRVGALESRINTRRSSLLVALLEEVATLRNEILELRSAPSNTTAASTPPLASQSLSRKSSPLKQQELKYRQHIMAPPMLQSPPAVVVVTRRSAAIPPTLPTLTIPPANNTLSAPPPPPPQSPPSSQSGAPRAMPLRAVRDFLSALYASKARADARPATPWETLEGHLYVFLRHTVGLRSLIATHARSFLSAVARYARVDTECLLAQRILRSECDEGFRRGAFAAVAEGASDALQAILRSRAPNASSAVLAAALVSRGVDARGSGTIHIPLTAEEWRALPAALYADESDIASALATLESAALRNAASTALGIPLGYRESPAALLLADGADVDAAVEAEENINTAINALSPTEARALLARDSAAGSLPWSIVIRELQLLALERHARFLRAFISMWRSADVARTGTLSMPIFAALIDKAAPAAVPAARALATEAAARGNADITFSAAVAALASGAPPPPRTRSEASVYPPPPQPADATVLLGGDDEEGEFSDKESLGGAATAVDVVAVAVESIPIEAVFSKLQTPLSPPIRRANQTERAQRVSLMQPSTRVTNKLGEVVVASRVVASRAGKVSYSR